MLVKVYGIYPIETGALPPRGLAGRSGEGTGVIASEASLANRCARRPAVLTRVAASCSLYSFQATAPSLAWASFRKCLLALRASTLSCSAILGAPSAPQSKEPRVWRTRSEAPIRLCQYILGQSVGAVLMPRRDFRQRICQSCRRQRSRTRPSALRSGRTCQHVRRH